MVRKHIFIEDIKKELRYVSPRKGRSGLSIPIRLASHGPNLKNKFEKLWRNDPQDKDNYKSYSSKAGLYVEFRGEPGYDLQIKSLERLKSHISLMNARYSVSNGKKQAYATVFIPEEKKQIVLGLIEKYIQYGKNKDFIDSISTISKAITESFWNSPTVLMPKSGEKKWVEVWIDNAGLNSEEKFLSFLKENGIEYSDKRLKFPERSIFLVFVDKALLQTIIDKCPIVAEFRATIKILASQLPTDAQGINAFIEQILNKTSREQSNTSLCLLDTGVNNKHPLIQPFLDDSDLHSVDSTWGTYDHEGHGTLMAGTALYGDLSDVIASTSHTIPYILESVKIWPNSGVNAPALYGSITAEGISLAEIKNAGHNRVVCLATTADSVENGKPSSWSAALDAIASGFLDDQKRLLIVSAGNIQDSKDVLPYPQAVKTFPIQEPAQAWNALTVGAYTNKDVIADPSVYTWAPIAKAGQISPFSTSSLSWDRKKKWPIKPEIVLEGGNACINDQGEGDCHRDLEVISTHFPKHYSSERFSSYPGTSPAAAQASRIAALISSEYENIWPETIRGLLVHSATWTDAMKKQFLIGNNKTSYADLLRVCGYGVPDINKTRYCLNNSLTLISQEEIQPYIRNEDRQIKKNVMHFYDLPWPKKELEDLGGMNVKMRITLSYFIESSPGERGWTDKYLYPSACLRFDINSPGEDEVLFKRRVNKAISDSDDDLPETESASSRWLLGANARNVGSIHSDIWEGTAVDLASSNKIAVYPINGWWLTRHHLNRFDKKMRYSLIVSIESIESEIDIYTPVLAKIQIPIKISGGSR